MHPEELLQLLGRYHTDPVVEAALSHYRVRNRPEVEIDEADPDGPVVETQSWVKNSRAGIEFGFDDEAAWIGLDETEYGKRPMLLTQIYLYGEYAGVRRYQEPLPLGLQLFDDRATVRTKLAALESTRHSYVRDTWDTSGFRVIVDYTKEEQSIGFVVFMLREPPLPALSYLLAPVPPVRILVEALGTPLGSPTLQRACGALSLEDRIEEIKDGGEADFRNPYGVILGFSPPIETTIPDSRELVLSRITFHQERELASRAWPGDLPFGMRFDDSPETAVERVGRPPDIRNDDSFSGYAVWHELKYTFHIFYDTMENRILRASLFASGFWEKWQID